MKYDAKKIKQTALGRWPHILKALAPGLHYALERAGRHTICPIYGGKDGFRLFKDYAETGGGICNTYGSYQDGLGLLQWVNGWNFPQTCEAVAGFLGLDAGETPSIKNHLPDPGLGLAETKENERRRASLKRVWSHTTPLMTRAAEPARLYLARRGLHWRDIDPKALRFHPGLAYYEECEKVGVFPALIALISDKDGKPVSLHRIYLTDEGYKAPVKSHKKMMPFPSDRCVTGGAIRLFSIENEPVVGVAEGIETALAVQQATGMPVWSCISATFLEKFQTPDDIEILVVWGDLDREINGRAAGQESTQSLVESCRDNQQQALGLIPPYPLAEDRKSIDWLDVKNQDGDEVLPSIGRIRTLITGTQQGGQKGWTSKVLNWMF